MTEGQPTKVENSVLEKLSRDELEALDKTKLVEKVLQFYSYLENKDTRDGSDLQALKESEEKYRQQLAEVTKRETLLLKTLTEKEREITDLASQIDELKQYQLPSNNQLRTMLLDPTVNVVINRLKKELDSTKQRLEESQSELSAWKFTQDSQTGKQLMAKCRTLLKENEELGKQISQGRIAKLEGEIALEKKLVEEMKIAQNDSEQFVMELDDDTEGLQATIYLLQQQLKEARDHIAELDGTTSQENDDQNNLGENDSTQSSLVDRNPEDTDDQSQDSRYQDEEHRPSNGIEDDNERTTESMKSESNSNEQVTTSPLNGNKKVTSSVVNGHNELMTTD